MSHPIKRVNTIKCAFARTAQRPTPTDIHKFIEQTLHINIDQLQAIQLVSEDNAFYVKLVSPTHHERLLKKHAGMIKFRYENDSSVDITLTDANENLSIVRVFNIPPEVESSFIRSTLAKYGKIKEITEEQWSSRFTFPVLNGIRDVSMTVTTPIPSYLQISGFRAHIQYEGQTRTCQICNATDHLRPNCPKRIFTLPIAPGLRPSNPNNMSQWPPISSVSHAAQPSDLTPVMDVVIPPTPTQQTSSPDPAPSTSDQDNNKQHYRDSPVASELSEYEDSSTNNTQLSHSDDIESTLPKDNTTPPGDKKKRTRDEHESPASSPYEVTNKNFSDLKVKLKKKKKKRSTPVNNE